MRILIVTEKASLEPNLLDGGASLLASLKKTQGAQISIMQFGHTKSCEEKMIFRYPAHSSNRFIDRVNNASFIAHQVHRVAKDFECIIFIHVSMAFHVRRKKLPVSSMVFCLPMFLTPSYQLSQLDVPSEYFDLENKSLNEMDCLVTPSYYEKSQLMDVYHINPRKIRVIPRGIDETQFLPQARRVSDRINFCGIGSIKPQKNTLGLIQQFKRIHTRFPNSSLKIIGAVQDDAYALRVSELIKELQLEDSIVLLGYRSKAEINEIIQDCHIHLCMFNCETFGRVIFETLACGIPNIVLNKACAASDYLMDKPYAIFIDCLADCLDAVEQVLVDYDHRSKQACEVNFLFSDGLLSHLLLGVFLQKPYIVISDFDGTLYHKESASNTEVMMKYFKQYPVRVICSARSLDDLLHENKKYQLRADWLISYSGGLISDGLGRIVKANYLNETVLNDLAQLYPNARKVKHKGRAIQIHLPKHTIVENQQVCQEVYGDGRYIMGLNSTKLSAIVWLLGHIRWSGQVRALGDGPYDYTWLQFFDGVYIDESQVAHVRRTGEIKIL